MNFLSVCLGQCGGSVFLSAHTNFGTKFEEDYMTDYPRSLQFSNVLHLNLSVSLQGLCRENIDPNYVGGLLFHQEDRRTLLILDMTG